MSEQQAEFDLDAAQEQAKASLTRDFLTGEDREQMYVMRRPFYITSIPRLVDKTFNGEAVQQWEFDVEFADAGDGVEAETRTLTLGANAFRDAIATSMSNWIGLNQAAIGPLKLVKRHDLTGKPWDFEKWILGVDDKPVAVTPKPAAQAAKGTFKPKPQG